MQMHDAERLQDRCGDKPCHHPTVVKEYYLGADTGEMVCTTCGKAQTQAKWQEERSRAAGGGPAT